MLNSLRVVVALCCLLLIKNVALAQNAVRKVVQQDGEVRFILDGQVLTIRPLAPGAARIRIAPEGTHESPSLILAGKRLDVAYTVQESGTDILVKLPAMSAKVDRSSGAVSFLDAQDHVVLQEQPGSRSIKAATVQGVPTLAIEQAFASPADEALFGSGQFQDGCLNIRDLPRRLTQVNTQIAIPFILSSKGYGLLWHNNGMTELNPADPRIELVAGSTDGKSQVVNVTGDSGNKTETRQPGEFAGRFSVDQPGRTVFFLDVGQKMARRQYVEIDGKAVIDLSNLWLPPTIGFAADLSAGEHRVVVKGDKSDHPVLTFRPARNQTLLRSPCSEGIDYVVFVGAKSDDIFAAYRALSGPAPMMPLWAFGYIHCRERFHSQSEILSTAAEFRKRNLPMDVIVQDWQYWGKYGWNAMRFDEKDYPDPAQLVRDLHAQNVRLMVSVWSKIDTGSDLGNQFAEQGYYIPGTTWIDFFNPKAAELYAASLRDRMMVHGIDAWWQDATEPENDDLVGRSTAAGPGELNRLVYPLLVTRTVYEESRRSHPDQRVCILTRSAFPGEQRYAAATWSGDIGNDFGTLRRQITGGLNYAASGMPYWTTDAGGFFRPGNRQYTDTGYHERFLRWFQFATFCPLQRVHGYQTNTEFWNYGQTVETESRRYLELRYRLIPYIYTQASRITRDGSTLMRPLVMDFANDPAALAQNFEFMFGPSILVSPVVEAGAKTWPVYLPRTGAAWYDFWTGERSAGAQTVQVDAPLSTIPLHIPAGTILPLGPVMQSTADKPADPIELRIYAGADAHFTLYEDEGINYNYEKGAFAEIPMHWNDQTHALTIGPRRGEFPGMLKQRRFDIVYVDKNHGTGIDPAARPDASVTFIGQSITIKR